MSPTSTLLSSNHCKIQTLMATWILYADRRKPYSIWVWLWCLPLVCMSGFKSSAVRQRQVELGGAARKKPLWPRRLYDCFRILGVRASLCMPSAEASATKLSCILLWQTLIYLLCASARSVMMEWCLWLFLRFIALQPFTLLIHWPGVDLWATVLMMMLIITLWLQILVWGAH